MAGFVLVFFLTGRLVVDDSPAGRFLDLDDVEMDVESVLDSVEALGFFTLCRFGVGRGRGSEVDQLLLSTSATSKQGKNTPRRLTFDNQSRYARPVANSAIVWLDFEDVEGICPMQVSFERSSIFVRDYNVGGGVRHVNHPASKPLRVIGMVVLRNSGRGIVGGEPRQNTDGSVCGFY